MNNANILDSIETTLIDYSFLATMMYQDPITYQDTIDEWFGPGVGRMDSKTTFDHKQTLTNPNLAVNYDKFLDCHYPGRTLCELMVTCGSFNRPPPCGCAVRYGYDEPQQVSGDRSNSDVCGTKRSNDGFEH